MSISSTGRTGANALAYLSEDTETPQRAPSGGIRSGTSAQPQSPAIARRATLHSSLVQHAAQRDSGTVADTVGPHSAPIPRVKRGLVLGACGQGSPFRECRGGDALASASWSYDPFDQADHTRRDGSDGRGACEGWVREALRRIDRGAQSNLQGAVRNMRTDANTRRDGVADDLFGRVDRYQNNAEALALRDYSRAARIQLDGGASRGAATRDMFQHMRDHLGVGDLVHIRVGAVRPGTTEGRYGHALLLQRLADSQFALFDPNNGAFLYSSRRDMESALRRYMDEAFGETGLQLRPDSLQFYGRPAPSVGMQITRPQSDAAPSQPLSEPPMDDMSARQQTADAYRRSADISNSLSVGTLAAAAGQRDALSGDIRGLAAYALQGITQGRSTNLTDITEDIRQRLADSGQRLQALSAIRELQYVNPNGLFESVPGYARRRGDFDVRSGEGLVSDLQQHFGSMHRDSDSRFGCPIDVATLNLGFRPQPAAEAGAARPPDEQPVVVQRLRASADFRADPYEVYDPQAGVFHYANFDAMAQAMREMFASGYREQGGIDHVDTTYYANRAAPLAAAGVSDAPPAASPVANLSMSDIERRLGVIGSPSRATVRPDLPPPPLTVEPPAFVLRTELKRDTALIANPKPDGLFRPATMSPQDLKAHGGFDCESTRMTDINLALHDHDVAANPHVVDSAGYLGTFRNERTALERLPGDSGNGFIYYIAPSPNMVDVPGSLGAHARAASTGEVAAMGWIDYPQVRGWRVVEHGVPGQYVRNPDYRWDVYDQTRTSGAQPQLARLPVDSDAWREAPFKPFVSTDDEAVGAVRFKEDPNLTHALFYDAAWDKVRALNGLQSAGLDYRGPLRIHAYEAGDVTNTQIFIDQYNAVQIDTQRMPYTQKSGARHDFAMGNDGRFHLIGNYDKVLRVGHDGYVFLGDTPSDANSLNGVFEHDGHHLIHQEDMKFLTTGLSSYTPFVDMVNHGARSDWHLHTADGKEVMPPRVNAHSFRASSAGDAKQLYAFYNDPDSALPRNATRFVTKVPDNEYSGGFLGYVDKITPAQARGAEAWLRSHNAAWLFHDGFYATADEPGVLEVRKLGGTPVWRAEGLTSGWGEANFRTLSALSSSYNMPGETWQRVQGREARYDEALKALNRTATAGA